MTELQESQRTVNCGFVLLKPGFSIDRKYKLKLHVDIVKQQSESEI